MTKIVFIYGLLGSKRNFYYLEKRLDVYDTESIDLVGFGDEQKPKINYDVDDFLVYLEYKLNLLDDIDDQLILVGHSLGALLAKELTIRHPSRIIKTFLIAYPFLDNEKALKAYNYFDRKYAEGTWWTKTLCRTEFIYKWIFYPYFYFFKYEHRHSYIDAFKHTYQSAFGTFNNTIFNDNKEALSVITEKVVSINGEHDRTVDWAFSKHFTNYTIVEMGHSFFGFERHIENIIKSNLERTEHTTI